MPGMEVQRTDSVIFTPGSGQTPQPSPGKLRELEAELDSLRLEVNALKTTVDSLGNDHLLHQREFLEMKMEFEAVLPRLMSGDIKSSRIVRKNAEQATRADSNDLLTRYRRALNDCLRHRYSAAVPAFQDIITDYPNSRFVENCRYWIAQSFFNSGDYAAAVKGFQDVLVDTRFTHKDDDASIMLGITYVQMGRTRDALDQFRRFAETYPGSEYIEKVKHWNERLSTLQNRG
jgi:TolA-binding protein